MKDDGSDRDHHRELPPPDSTEPYEIYRRDVPENPDIRFRPLS